MTISGIKARDYPVVGGASAFCAWRTLNKTVILKVITLEAEWDVCKRQMVKATYPWVNTDRGCFLANFKPNRDYAADHCTQLKQSHMSQMVIIYTTWQGMFQNGQTLLTTNAYEYVLNESNVLDASNKRKVVRGGSWKDVAYFPSKHSGF
jgi:formylglycine-generating enzyme required for sulfatase activity